MSAADGIALSAIHKTYTGKDKSVEALRDATLACPAGSFTALIGPSGCGKSTILRIAMGLEKPDSGEVLLSGMLPDKAIAKGITGVAFQEAALLPWRSVIDNVALPLEVLGRRRSDHQDEIERLVSLVGLSGFENALPGELSGGMRQRVAIARSLITSPSVLFLDEPFGALDQILRRQMNIELQRIWRDTGSTALMVTHSIDEAVFLADQVYVMQSAPGRMVERIAIPFERPRNTALFSTPEFHALTDQIAGVLHAGT